MSTLDINKLEKEKKRFIIYSIICIIFTFIYELFSHGVISYYMILSFIFPLLGFIEIVILCKKNKLVKINSHNFFKASLLTFTLGSILKGILDIYGTTNKLIIIYLILGLILLVLSIITYLKKN